MRETCESGAEACDDAMDTRDAKNEYTALVNGIVAQSKKKHPAYVVYQNELISQKMSTDDRKALAVSRYNHAKAAKAGDTIFCPGCGLKMVKTSYQHTFCKNRMKGHSNCKDFYNNWINPVRFERTKEYL